MFPPNFAVSGNIHCGTLINTSASFSLTPCDVSRVCGNRTGIGVPVGDRGVEAGLGVVLVLFRFLVEVDVLGVEARFLVPRRGVEVGVDVAGCFAEGC